MPEGDVIFGTGGPACGKWRSSEGRRLSVREGGNYGARFRDDSGGTVSCAAHYDAKDY